jgi:hypothetical protein
MGMRTTITLFAITLVGLTVGVGCANRQSQMGVENLWRADPSPTFDIGSTTQSEVMKVLGPPSQVIALGEQTLFYYLREQQKLESLSVIIYSHSRERIMYDRAIFFFDGNGLLQDFALSEEAIPRREKKPSK